MRTKTITRALAAAAVCAAGLGAVQATADEGTVAQTDVLAAAEVTTTTAIQSAATRRFGELRRSRRSDDPMPAEWDKAIADDADQRLRWGANATMSRRVAPGVWLIPGNGFVCVAMVDTRDGSLGFSCATPLEVEQGMLQPSAVDANGSGVVTGVMTDGVESVTLVDSDGGHRTVAVDRNIYRAAIDRSTVAVRWTDALGVERSRTLAFNP